MTRFILSRRKLAFLHILRHRPCIKIPHLPFWALAAVAKTPSRSSSRVAVDSDCIINSATFRWLLNASDHRKSYCSLRGYLRGQGGHVQHCVCGPQLSRSHFHWDKVLLPKLWFFSILVERNMFLLVGYNSIRNEQFELKHDVVLPHINAFYIEEMR